MNGARTAGANTAAELRAMQPQEIAQRPQQRHGRIGIEAMPDAVDSDISHLVVLAAVSASLVDKI
jgi:hypothetical protein